jgi:hypothetical protein
MSEEQEEWKKQKEAERAAEADEVEARMQKVMSSSFDLLLSPFPCPLSSCLEGLGGKPRGESHATCRTPQQASEIRRVRPHQYRRNRISLAVTDFSVVWWLTRAFLTCVEQWLAEAAAKKAAGGQ